MPAPVTPDMVYHLKTVGDPALSPDGTSLAYTLGWVDKESLGSRSRIMLMDLGDGSCKEFTGGEKDSAPRFSPDGRQLAFLISLPEDSLGSPVLKFALHLPEWIPEQRMQVSINDVLVVENLPIVMGKGYWTQVSVELQGQNLKPENNFVSVLFSHSSLPPGIEHWEAAAMISSIRLVMMPSSDTSTIGAALP